VKVEQESPANLIPGILFFVKMFSDDGIYLIQYLERFMEDPDLFLPLMTGRQKRIDLWFDTDVIAEKRKTIQLLMKEKHEDWILSGKDKKRELQAAMRSDSDDDLIIIES
jgi:hypothetical protein